MFPSMASIKPIWMKRDRPLAEERSRWSVQRLPFLMALSIQLRNCPKWQKSGELDFTPMRVWVVLYFPGQSGWDMIFRPSTSGCPVSPPCRPTRTSMAMRPREHPWFFTVGSTCVIISISRRRNGRGGSISRRPLPEAVQGP